LKKKGIILILLSISIASIGLALILDFNGKYVKTSTVVDAWCGKSIEIQKIRFNKYRITWELVTGETSVLELIGKVDGDMIDFRKGKADGLYGYTYALTDNKKKLIVTLTVPNKTVVCQFVRLESD
jgi:hypothetical protein